MESKGEIRTRYLALRRSIAPVDAARWSASIQERVVALAEMERGDVYIHIAAPDEVETRGIIRAMLAQGRRVLAPITRDAGVMDWGEVTSIEALTVGRFGFLGPAQVAERAEEPHRGVAIVPCVAFTAHGERLGRGGGYYDRFLATFDGPTIALAYECQRAETLPFEEHDIRVGCIATEIGRIYRI